MRRSALGAGLILAIVLGTSPVSAQSTRLGIKGGVASTTVYGDATDDESLTRFSAGASLELPIGPMLSIQPEVLFSLKGSRFLGEDAGDIRLSYIEIPVLAKATFGTGTVRPSLFAGPSIAFKTGCEIEFVEASEAVECDSDVGDVEDVNGTDFGAIFGAGIEYGFGPANLLVDGRFNLGLSSVIDGPDSADVKNRAFALLAGVSFPLGLR